MSPSVKMTRISSKAAIGMALALLIAASLPATAFGDWGSEGDGSCPDPSDSIWYLDLNGVDNDLQQEQPDATMNTAVLDLVTNNWWWYSDEFTETSSFVDDLWQVCFVYQLTGSGDLTIKVYAVDERGDTSGTLLASGTTTLSTAFYGYPCVMLTPNGPGEVQAGQHLALRFYWKDMDTLSVRYGDSVGVERFCSHVVAPIPEIPTLVLTAVGLLGLSGYVAWRRRSAVHPG